MPKALTSALGRLILVKRREVGLSQQQLADQAGVDKGTVSRIERGTIRQPDLQTLAALAVPLGLNTDALVSAAGAPATVSESPQQSRQTVPSPVTLRAHTSPTGEAPAKAPEGEGQMSGRWTWLDEDLDALPAEVQLEARHAVRAAIQKALQPFLRDVARRGHRDVGPRAKMAR